MKQILTRLFEHEKLNRDEASEIMTNMAAGKYNESQIAAFMSVYLMRTIDLEELAGFRQALLNTALKVNLAEYEPVDIVGTGGDGKNTFNISTLSCFVLAGAGYKVAKHGNYGATSISGASNVLEYYGAKFTTENSKLRKSIEESGVAYLHAPLFNPAMKNVAPVRRALGVRTFFNILGPLISPVQPKYQVLGVYSLKMMRIYEYFNQKGDFCYTLLHSLDGYDEVSLTAPSKIVTNKGSRIRTPEEMGYRRYRQEEMCGGNSLEDAALIFIKVLDNKSTDAQRDVVEANSAFAIQTVSPGLTFDECRSIAAESLKTGRAKEAFDKFLKIYS